MDLTRRELGRLALGAAAAASWRGDVFAQATNPNSMVGGVQVGVLAPDSFMNEAPDAATIVARVVELGISAVELQSTVIEGFAGAPGLPRGAGAATPAPQAAPAAAAAASTLTREQQAADALRRWRLSQSMTAFRDLRQRFDNAGVSIQIVRFDLGPTFVDEEIDYSFQVAKALGARAITCEPPVREAKRLGLFADKHQMMLGFHGHADVTNVDAFGRPGAWEQAFFYSRFNGASIDLGQFVAGNSRSALAFIREYHDRITNIHLTDRRRAQGTAVPWGEGDAEIREVLDLMRREKYPFQATLELDYPVPAGSTRTAELAKGLAFCREVLR